MKEVEVLDRNEGSALLTLLIYLDEAPELIGQVFNDKFDTDIQRVTRRNHIARLRQKFDSVYTGKGNQYRAQGLRIQRIDQ